MGAALGAHGSLGVPARDRGSGPVGEARGGGRPALVSVVVSLWAGTGGSLKGAGPPGEQSCSNLEAASAKGRLELPISSFDGKA